MELVQLQRLSVPKNQRLEKSAREKGYKTIAGVDEAGRGPLAGPVVAAVCIIPEGVVLKGIDDSKKLTAKERERLFAQIKANPQILFGVGVIEAFIIDQVNILRATMQAMMAAVAALSKKPDYILVDGNRLPNFDILGEAIVRGDCLSQAIMAAAIVAKCTRDQMMQQFHLRWPVYGFDQHKGYGTEKHVEALKAHGPCPIHRKTFALVRGL